jgi:hypothetical protein
MIELMVSNLVKNLFLSANFQPQSSIFFKMILCFLAQHKFSIKIENPRHLVTGVCKKLCAGLF